MNSIRQIWIIKLPNGTKNGSSIFSRKFPTVEKKAKMMCGERYVPLPHANQFIPLILQEASGVLNTATQFIPSRDSCVLSVQKPFYKIQTEHGIIWPIVAIENNDILVCCLPLVEEMPTFDGQGPDIPFSTITSLSVAFEFVCCLSEYLKVTSQELSSRLSELPVFINEAAPLGHVRDCCVDNILARLSNKPCSATKSHKIPAWKSWSYKGKNTISINVSECISASQCAQETWEDTIQVYGMVSCKADLEGTLSDVSLSLSHQNDVVNVPLSNLIVHPCVQRADSHELEKTDRESKLSPRRVRFCPAMESFTLCHYKAEQMVEIPIFGVYHMKPEELKASVTVQLKLNDQIKNNFDFCELHIPFYTRSAIASFEGSPTQGSIYISSNKKEIIWSIGQKFNSRDQQVLLAATVVFSDSQQGLPSPSLEDAFCRGDNSYAQLFFKIQDFTHTGCCVDPKSIQISPPAKFKVNVSREYCSVDYKIWNSNGEGLKTKP